MTRHSKPVANTAKKADKNNGNNSKHVQNQARVERVVGRVEPSTSWQKMKTNSPKRTMTTKKGGRGGGLKFDEAKIRAKGKV